jgi:hypothetical protein
MADGFGTIPAYGNLVGGPAGGSISQNFSSGMNQSTQQSVSNSFIPDYSQTPILEGIAQYAQQMAPVVYQWGMDQFQRQQGNIDNLMRRAQQWASPQQISADVGMAEAGVQQAGEQARQAAERDLQSYGVDPSAGRTQDLELANRVSTAAAAAGAGNQQRMSDIAFGNTMYNQALAAGGQNISTGYGAANALNNLLSTAMRLPYPPLGTTARSQQQATGSNVGGGYTLSRGATPSGAGGGGGGISHYNPQTPGGGGGMSGAAGDPRGTAAPTGGGAPGWYSAGGGGGGMPRGFGDIPSPSPPDPFNYWGVGNDPSITGLSDTQYYGGTADWTSGFGTGALGTGPGFFGGGINPQTGGGDWSNPQTFGGTTDPSLTPGWTPDFSGGGGGGGSSGFDTGGGGGSTFQAGGEVGDDPTQGGFVSQSLSPSGGNRTDDVDAQLNAGEFVIPKDVAAWKGQEYFYKLMAQSRKNLAMMRNQANSYQEGGDVEQPQDQPFQMAGDYGIPGAGPRYEDYPVHPETELQPQTEAQRNPSDIPSDITGDVPLPRPRPSEADQPSPPSDQPLPPSQPPPDRAPLPTQPGQRGAGPDLPPGYQVPSAGKYRGPTTAQDPMYQQPQAASPNVNIIRGPVTTAAPQPRPPPQPRPAPRPQPAPQPQPWAPSTARPSQQREWWYQEPSRGGGGMEPHTIPAPSQPAAPRAPSPDRDYGPLAAAIERLARMEHLPPPAQFYDPVAAAITQAASPRGT